MLAVVRHVAWLVAVIIVATLQPTRLPSTGLHDAELEAQLRQVLRDLESTSSDMGSTFPPEAVLRGAKNFFTPFPGGNGRACATCHSPSDGFSLSPATVEERWQRLQRERRLDPRAIDPLFSPSDADDGVGDFTLLRTRALFKVRVPLPAGVRLTDDPAATHVTVSRAASPLNLLAHTEPYQQDRSAATLEAQAREAVRQHMQPSDDPSEAFVTTVAAFERHLFSSARVRGLSRAIETGSPLPTLDPPLTAIERRGKELFDDFCGRCHGGPAQVRNLENRIFPPFDGSTNPTSINVVVSNPPPNGFPASLIQGRDFDLPTRRFTIELPDRTTVVLESSDPGTVLTDTRAVETVGGNQVFNRFDIPTLHGINATAPYFHDHRARTLEEVVKHYQVFFGFIRDVRGFPLPRIADEEVGPIVAYMKKAL